MDGSVMDREYEAVVRRPPELCDWFGLNAEQRSRKALALTRAAARIGCTKYLARHLDMAFDSR
jgi:hypothetical protein